MEYNATYSDPIPIERKVAKSNYDPHFYDHMEESKKPAFVLMSGISNSFGGVKTDKVEKVNMAELEARTLQASLKTIYNNIDRPDAESEFQLRYQKFLNKVSHFFKSGDNWVQPSNMIYKARQLKLLDSYPKFEEWIMTEVSAPKHMNWLHEAWLESSLIKRIIFKNQATRIGHWLTIFFQFNTFKNNRPIVSGFHLK